MSDYHPLKKVFHIGNNININEIYQARLTSPATYVSNIKINPIEKGNKLKSEYPLFILNTFELSSLSEQVIINSENIKRKLSNLPDLAGTKYLNRLLINELHSTNEIESIGSSKKEIAGAINTLEEYKNTDKLPSPKLTRFLGLVQLYINLDNTINLHTPKDIREIYNNLVSSEIEDKNSLDGNLFRKFDVEVGNNIKTEHIGVSEEDNIITSIENLIDFYNNAPLSKLYKAIIFHFYFEYIHPFYDGNGRVGRFILANMIAETLEKMSAITYSYSINRNKNKYYKSFSNTSNPLNYGEVTFFVKENLEILKSGQESLLGFLDENIEKLNTIHTYLNKNINNPKTKEILFILAQSYLFSAKDDLVTHSQISELLGISTKTLNTYLKDPLISDNIITISKKPKIYSLTDDFINHALTNNKL